MQIPFIPLLDELEQFQFLSYVHAMISRISYLHIFLSIRGDMYSCGYSWLLEMTKAIIF